MKAAAMLGVTVLASITAGASAQMVHFDNSSSVFQWSPSLQPGWNAPVCNPLDITQAANAQTTTNNNRSLYFNIQFFSGSTQTRYHRFTNFTYNTYSDTRIARSPNQMSFLDGRGGLNYTTVTQTFQPGEVVGPSLDWQPNPVALVIANTNYSAFLPANSFIGVRFPMPDGDHFGYVQVGSPTSVYQPIAWGYETRPNVPAVIPGGCGTSDFNGDGDYGTDADIEAFFACLGGSCCSTCYPSGADFNNDGDSGTDADIEAFFRVLGGTGC